MKSLEQESRNHIPQVPIKLDGKVEDSSVVAEPFLTSFKDGDKTPSIHSQQSPRSEKLVEVSRPDESSYKASRIDGQRTTQTTETLNGVAPESGKDLYPRSQQRTGLQFHADDTPTIPFKPIEPEKCRVYHSMPDSLKRLLCSNCDFFGNVRYQLGTGKCRRYGDGKV